MTYFEMLGVSTGDQATYSLDFDETWEQIFALLTTGSGKTKEMVIDSGATTTMTPKRNAFVTYKQIKPGLFVRTANNARIPVVGIGIIKAGQMQLLYKLCMCLISIKLWFPSWMPTRLDMMSIS